MSGLEKVVQLGIESYKKYRQIINTSLFGIPILGFTALLMYEAAVEFPRYHSAINHAKENGAKIERKHDSKLFRDDFYNSATITYTNQNAYGDTGENLTKTQPKNVTVGFGQKYANYYPHWLALTFGFYAYYFYKRNRGQSVNINYTLGENISGFMKKSLPSTLFGITAYLATSSLNELPRIETGVLAFLSLWMTTKHKIERKTIKKRADKARKEGIFRDRFYQLDELENLAKEAKNAFENRDLSACCKALHKQARVIRELQFGAEDFTHRQVPYGNIKHFFQRYRARKNPNSENDLKLIVMTPLYLELARISDLAEIIERNKVMAIEFMLLDYEMTSSKVSREQKGIEIYKKLESLGRIIKLGNRTNSVVAFVNCGILGNRYVIKEDDARQISLEARQTIAVRAGFVGDNAKGIEVAEISQVYMPGNFRELGNKGRLLIAFEEGESLHNYLLRKKNESSEVSVELLVKHAEANMRSTKYGISSEDENRINKVRNDLRDNIWLSGETIAVIDENLLHCFELTQHIPQLYDRDGNPGNSIIGQNGSTVLIDFPDRKKSLPLYCLVKQLEHTGAIGYDRTGFETRSAVVEAGMKSVGLFTKHTVAAYFGVCVTKFVSYTTFFHGKENAINAAIGYRDGAIFGIDVILSEFRSMYSPGAINGLSRIRQALAKETLFRN